jgi:hypothetical protein
MPVLARRAPQDSDKSFRARRGSRKAISLLLGPAGPDLPERNRRGAPLAEQDLDLVLARRGPGTAGPTPRPPPDCNRLQIAIQSARGRSKGAGRRAVEGLAGGIEVRRQLVERTRAGASGVTVLSASDARSGAP